MPRKMGRAAVLVGPQTIEMREFPVPESVPDNAALVRVEMCGVCGTDPHLWSGGSSLRYPVILGHEAVGRIELIGPEAAASMEVEGRKLEVGDRVVWPSSIVCGRCYYCRWLGPEHAPLCENRKGYGGGMSAKEPPYWVGGFAEYVYLFPGTWVSRVPEDVPTEVAVLTDVIASVHRVERAFAITPRPDAVLIQGSGPIGIMAAVKARTLGAKQVIMTGAPRHRLELAKTFGVDFTVDIEEVGEPAERVRMVRELTGGRGADVVVECAGVPAAFVEGLQMTRRGGTLVELGHYTDRGVTSLNPYSDVCFRDVTVLAQYGVAPAQYARDLALLAAGQYPYADLVTHRFRLDQLQEALGTAQRQECMKAVIVP